MSGNIVAHYSFSAEHVFIVAHPRTTLTLRPRSVNKLMVIYNNASVLCQGVLCDHGEMGHHHQTGHQLAEPSPEHLHTHAVWGHDRSVHKGNASALCVCTYTELCVLYLYTTTDFCQPVFYRNTRMKVKAGCTDRWEYWRWHELLIIRRWHFVHSVGNFLYDDHQNKVLLLSFVIQWLDICVVSCCALFLCVLIDLSVVCLQNEKPLFSKDGLKLFFTRAIPQGGRGKFFHISMSISQVGGRYFKHILGH